MSLTVINLVILSKTTESREAMSYPMEKARKHQFVQLKFQFISSNMGISSIVSNSLPTGCLQFKCRERLMKEGVNAVLSSLLEEEFRMCRE